MNDNTLYQICMYCDHFVERNISVDDGPNIAEYVHLDNGEKEHDHDATPMQHCILPLAAWRAIRPELFTTYRDGMIGPNSVHYRPIPK